MICKENSKEITVRKAVMTKPRGESVNAVLMQLMIVGASIYASGMILGNLTAAGNVVLLLLGFAILACSVRWMIEEYVILPSDQKVIDSTVEYSRRVHSVSNDELIRYFMIDTCPQVKGIYLKDDNTVCLEGKHSLHFVEFYAEGAAISSEKKDYRADKEANAIMKFLVAEQN